MIFKRFYRHASLKKEESNFIFHFDFINCCMLMMLHLLFELTFFQFILVFMFSTGFLKCITGSSSSSRINVFKNEKNDSIATW